MRFQRPYLILAIFAISIPCAVSASDTVCYDVKVRAKPVAQIPTSFPQTDMPNRIIMSWPWFVDLDVRRVIDGDLEVGLVETLGLLHTDYRSKTMTFLLRRSTVGSFNIIRFRDIDTVKRCGPEVGAVEPYLRLASNADYAAEREAGEAELRRYYEDDD